MQDQLLIHNLRCMLFSGVVSDSLQAHGVKYTRLPCPSLSTGVCSNSCPLSQWCNQTISSSFALLSCPRPFPKSGSFPRNWLFTSGGQSIRALASASVFPMNIQSWFPLGLTGLSSLQFKGLSKVFCNTTIQNISSSALSLLYVHFLHPYLTTGKTIALTIRTFVSKAMSLVSAFYCAA